MSAVQHFAADLEEQGEHAQGDQHPDAGLSHQHRVSLRCRVQRVDEGKRHHRAVLAGVVPAYVSSSREEQNRGEEAKHHTQNIPRRQTVYAVLTSQHPLRLGNTGVNLHRRRRFVTGDDRPGRVGDLLQPWRLQHIDPRIRRRAGHRVDLNEPKLTAASQ